MKITAKQAKAGDSMAFPLSNNIVEVILSGILSIFDSTWRRRREKPWHMGLIIKVLDEGEVVTMQAIASGVHFVTYNSIDDLSECKFYRWLDAIDEDKLHAWAAKHERRRYDVAGYLWTALGAISMFALKYPFKVVDRNMFCWEVVAEAYRYLGRECQPEEEPVLISRMINALETG